MMKPAEWGNLARRARMRLGAAALCMASCANAPAPQSPADQFGDLLVAVQEGRVFPDGKTFVDAVPKSDPGAIMKRYRSESPQSPVELRAFVLANFTVPGVNDQSVVPMREHVRLLWPQLVRTPGAGEGGAQAAGSFLPLNAPYAVPGGRFRELYYWDSYFTMLGLAVDGHDDVVESMIDNFTDLIERYGHIPNGTRSYYLSRSQPPFFALMLDLSKQTDPAKEARRVAALRREYAYWMAGAEDCTAPGAACGRVARMPDGSVLNRYWDDRETPRDESFAEDRATADKAHGRAATEVYRDLRAGAESGWDFSSRWLVDPKDLSTIRTTRVVPIDLNALLWAVEKRIEKGCRAVSDQSCASEFAQRAQRRKAAIDRYLWVGSEARFADWLLDERRPGPVLSSATLYPLFVGMASSAQAKAVAATTREALLAPGGLRTTALRTGEQWDAPNGWAPLQWVAIAGLRRYAQEPLAREIARRWLATVSVTYGETGKMLEKYDVEERLPGGGGEYPLQDGFGWTNGVTSALMERYPDLGGAG